VSRRIISRAYGFDAFGHELAIVDDHRAHGTIAGHARQARELDATAHVPFVSGRCRHRKTIVAGIVLLIARACIAPRRAQGSQQRRFQVCGHLYRGRVAHDAWHLAV